MSQDLYSVEQVAGLLGLHVRTVRNYVRDGALKAVKIGKQYRISRADLEAMTGKPIADAVRHHRHVEVSSIVEIDAIGVDAANRLTNYLMAAAKSRPQAIVQGPDAAIWYGTSTRICRITTDGKRSDFNLPSNLTSTTGGTVVQSLVFAPDGNLWGWLLPQ